MSKEKLHPLQERLRFSQTDPAELMPAYVPSYLSPAQQDRLDTIKFQTMRSDYEYFREHPEIGEIVGFLSRNVIRARPLNVEQYLCDLFQDPTIADQLESYRRNKKCRSTDIQQVLDLGYQEDGTLDPCPTPPLSNPQCEENDGQVWKDHGMMERMRQMYADRHSMMPVHETNWARACGKTCDSHMARYYNGETYDATAPDSGETSHVSTNGATSGTLQEMLDEDLEDEQDLKVTEGTTGSNQSSFPPGKSLDDSLSEEDASYLVDNGSLLSYQMEYNGGNNLQFTMYKKSEGGD